VCGQIRQRCRVQIVRTSEYREDEGLRCVGPPVVRRRQWPTNHGLRITKTATHMLPRRSTLASKPLSSIISYLGIVSLLLRRYTDKLRPHPATTRLGTARCRHAEVCVCASHDKSRFIPSRLRIPQEMPRRSKVQGGSTCSLSVGFGGALVFRLVC
jgi:hypothetical protein